MKITLTNEEAQKIAQERIRLCLSSSSIDEGIKLEFEVAGAVQVPQHEPIDKIIRDIESLNYATHQKIAAIKRLREMVPGMGLAAAKWCVENWNTWKGRALQLQRIPQFRCGEGGYIIGVD